MNFKLKPYLDYKLNTAHPLARGLVGAWIFSCSGAKSTNFKAIDRSIYNIQTAYESGVSYSVDGDGSHMLFDGGVDAGVYALRDLWWRDTGQLTLFAVLKCDSFESDDNQIIASDESSGPRSFQFRIDNSSGTLRAVPFVGGATKTFDSTTNLTAGILNSASFVNDGVNGYIYVNGEAAGSNATGQIDADLGHVGIGCRPNGDFTDLKETFNGKIYVAYIWERALTAGDIRYLHNFPLGAPANPLFVTDDILLDLSGDILTTSTPTTIGPTTSPVASTLPPTTLAPPTTLPPTTTVPTTLAPTTITTTLAPTTLAPTTFEPCWAGDDFTDGDGNPPNPALWIETDTFNLASIQSNEYRFASYGATPDREAGIVSTYMLSGDFDIRVDFEVYSNTQPASSVNYVPRLRVRNADITKHVSIMRERSIAHDGYAWLDNTHAGAFQDEYTRADATGKLRITRSGTTLKVWMWDSVGSEWEYNGDTNGMTADAAFSDDVYIQIWMKKESNEDVDAAVDNFIIAEGCPTTFPPTTLGPTTLPPTTLPPTTLAPTTLAPTTLSPTTLAPTTLAPTTLPPTTLAPTTLPPTTLAPTTLPPTTLPPTTLAPTTLAPTTLPPTTLPPTTLAPTTLPPTTLAPTTLAPTTLPPTTLAPTTVPTTAAPTTLAPTTLAPTTLAPTTLAPTTVAPTTVAPTTLPPTTAAPTTLAPTTVPTTAAPTTVTTTLAPTTTLTTLAPTTAIPAILCEKPLYSTITDSIPLSSYITAIYNLKSTITEEVRLDANLCW